MKHRSIWICVIIASCLTPRLEAGIVEDWNNAFLQAVRKEAPPPCLVSRNLPILHLAMHRAAQAAGREELSEGDLARAVFLAGDRVFLTFFPSHAGGSEAIRSRYNLPQSVAPGGTMPRWQVIAEAAVQRTLQERENDGSATTVHYVPHEEPGQWRRTPPKFRPPEFPHWGLVKPFVLESASQFRPPPPPVLSDPRYAETLNEVKALGAKESGTRTDEQTMIAHFWSDFSYTTSPAGHWNDIARQLSLNKQMGVVESARLFAILNVTLADACIAIWDCKYHYNYWRPVTAIQRAGEDKNVETEADTEWAALLPAPPHPEYVSGHSGISGAAATVLARFFDGEDVAFEAESDDVKDVKRRFTSFWACAEEIAKSRVYGGIHYSVSGEQGLVLGKKVAEHALQHFVD